MVRGWLYIYILKYFRLIIDIGIRDKINKFFRIKNFFFLRVVNKSVKKEVKEWKKIFVMCINDKGF